MPNLSIRLPDEAQDYAADIRRFVDAMVFKLGRNSHKGHWEESRIDDVLRMAMSEIAELREAIKRGNMIEVILEAADVANFALIAASLAIDGRHHETVDEVRGKTPSGAPMEHSSDDTKTVGGRAQLPSGIDSASITRTIGRQNRSSHSSAPDESSSAA